MLPKKLIKILSCPKCKRTVKEKGMFLICNYCKLAYPIFNEDTLNLLIEDTWKLKKAKKSKFKHNLKL